MELGRRPVDARAADRAEAERPQSVDQPIPVSGFLGQQKEEAGIDEMPGRGDLEEDRAGRGANIRVADPKACQCGEVLKGVIEPWERKVTLGPGSG